ncbi:MAG: DsbA family protein [Gemmatimonadetes bacterium]|nr:DsbA family protein [Gemmatimonadota bacterium]
MNRTTLTPPVGPGDHARGPADAPVTLVEYGDYECPHCGAAHPVVQLALRQLGDQLRFVYRHFPLTEIHPDAEPAAEAAEAAGAQGRFWAMHDAIFEHQDALGVQDLVALATTLKLDAARLGREVLAHVHLDAVREDFLSGVRSGVNGTPTFFINGERYDGDWRDPVAFIGALQAAGSGLGVR